jgi:hypothetical protein
LVANDTNGANDVFVLDLIKGTTSLVSISNTGGNAGGTSRGSVMTPERALCRVRQRRFQSCAR